MIFKRNKTVEKINKFNELVLKVRLGNKDALDYVINEMEDEIDYCQIQIETLPKDCDIIERREWRSKKFQYRNLKKLLTLLKEL